jgi:demethylmenaquinone methyltransferase/2-methoxy-6-polyprenyl-1,4-benzoquinol methylase
MFHFYFKRVLPKVGGWISGQPQAYSYLPKSVGEFYSVEQLYSLIEDAGLVMKTVKKLTFGVTVAYLAEKE